MAAPDLKKYTKLAPYLEEHEDIWLSYDREADVIYISFEKPLKADDSEQMEEGIIARKRNGDVVGITLLNGSQWM
ncbi:MAG: DUF2283 domain-containing protein [bacterium]